MLPIILAAAAGLAFLRRKTRKNPPKRRKSRRRNPAESSTRKAKITKVILPEYVLPCDWARTLPDGRAWVQSIRDARLAFSSATKRAGGSWVMGGAEVVRADGSTETVLL